MNKKLLLSKIFLFIWTASAIASNGPVKAYEGTIERPTYRTYSPEKAPIFTRMYSYQNALRAVYPYPMDDYVSDVKVDSLHKAVFLENDYVKVCIIPQFGGRIYYVIDKTNNYDIIYHNHVIKPRNVGMLGSWLSGGVEWNVFHHHRNTTMIPSDYAIVDNADGSKTVWVGEIENRHRMSWSIGVTLFPDKSYLEITGRFYNISQDRNSMLHWANVAVHANENYQVVYPESTDFATYHHKFSHVHWPVAQEPFRGQENYPGVDLSWWKNIPSLQGESLFVQNLQDDFIGGYDHGKRAGTILTGDHNIDKGGKLWTWGCHAYGHGWDCVTLTDEDGPYIELMVSAYSDNQPDYCWINPGETKEYHAYWYGCRDLDNIRRANRLATVDMDIYDDGRIHVAANTTELHNKAKVVVSKDGATIYSKQIVIAPDKPFADDFMADNSDGADKTHFTMSLYDDKGDLMIDYTPIIKDVTKPLPKDVVPVNPDPKTIASNDECYFIGMRNLQFHQAHVDPNDYFLEVLRRDPNDVRCNTQVGISYRQAADYENAKKYLRAGIERQTAFYTRPADGEAMYNLGLVLKEEGNWKDAIDTLYRAVWDYEYASAGYYEVAQISNLLGDTQKALDEATMSINYNGMNLNAKCLKVSLLRKMGRKEEAVALAKEIKRFNELNYYANYELALMGAQPFNNFKILLRDQPESYLDVAVQYFRNGFADEGVAVLLESEKIKPYATTEYYLGYMADIAGDKDAAGTWFKKAESACTDYVFPFRIETDRPYRKALEYMPESAVTYNYLGNLWYNKQPEKALEYWTKAVQFKPDYAAALRNIGWYWNYKGEYSTKDRADYRIAADYYKKAIAADPSEGYYLAEADEILERLNAPVEERYELFKGKEDVYNYHNNYYAQERAVKQMILAGDLEQAYSDLTTRFYGRRELSDNLHDVYVDACELLTYKAWHQGDNDAALKWALAANEYPSTMEYPHLEYYARDAQVFYLIGLAYEKTGDDISAKEWYTKASNVEINDQIGFFFNCYVNDLAYNYEKALAMKKLDPKANVRAMLKAAVKAGENAETTYVNNFFDGHDHGPYLWDINAGAYYTQAMGYLGLGRKSKAMKYFRLSNEQKDDCAIVNYYLGKYDFDK